MIAAPFREQVVEVLSAAPPYTYGTGYVIGPTLVLTARHVLSDRVWVRFGAGPDPSVRIEAEPVWRAEGEEVDLALLRLATPLPRVRVPRLGHILPETTRSLPFTAAGFPAFNEIVYGGPVREVEQVDGQIRTLSNAKSGLVDLFREDRPLTLGGEWRGMSGAAVFARDALVGVVITTGASDAPLRAIRIAAATGAYTSALPGFTEPPESVERFRALLAADGISPDAEPARRRPTYADTILSQTCDLRERSAELAELAAFAVSDGFYAWWRAGPWAGKTALAVEFAAHPPSGVDVVAFLVSRARGQQTKEFHEAVCDQLSALLDEAPPATPSQQQFESLWRVAAELAATTGRQLVLLVDGLDENDDPAPISALLPATAMPYTHVLVFSRERMGRVPPLGHPLRDGVPVRDLLPSPHAARLRERAMDELDTLLMDGADDRLLGLLAVAGPLTVEEARHLSGMDRLAVRRSLDLIGGRLLRTMDGERYAFAHDQLREATLTYLTPEEIEGYGQAVIGWAADYAAQDWPDSTPGYLADVYPSFLSAGGRGAELAVLPSPGRTRLLHTRSGHDGRAVEEIDLAMHAVSDVPTLCGLAVAKKLLVERVAGYPAALALAWAYLGEWEHARYLAESLDSQAERAVTLMRVGQAMFEAGHADPLHRLDAPFAQSLLMIDTVEAWAAATSWRAALLALTGRLDEAGEAYEQAALRVIGYLDDPRLPGLVIDLAAAAYQYGCLAASTAIFDLAEERFPGVVAMSEWVTMIRAALAEGQRERGERLAEEVLAGELADYGMLTVAAILAHDLGRTELVEPLLERADAELGPTPGAEELLWLADGAAAAGAHELAERLLSGVEDARRYALADVVRNGMRPLALRWLDEAEAEGQGHAGYLTYLAGLAEQLDLAERAHALLTQAAAAAETTEEFAEVALHLAMAGHEEAARQAAERAEEATRLVGVPPPDDLLDVLAAAGGGMRLAGRISDPGMRAAACVRAGAFEPALEAVAELEGYRRASLIIDCLPLADDRASIVALCLATIEEIFPNVDRAALLARLACELGDHAMFVRALDEVAAGEEWKLDEPARSCIVAGRWEWLPELLARLDGDPKRRLRHSLGAAGNLTDEALTALGDEALALNDLRGLQDAAVVMAERGLIEACHALLDAAFAIVEAMDPPELAISYGPYLEASARCGEVQHAVEEALRLPHEYARDATLEQLARIAKGTEWAERAALGIEEPASRVKACAAAGTVESLTAAEEVPDVYDPVVRTALVEAWAAVDAARAEASLIKALRELPPTAALLDVAIRLFPPAAAAIESRL